MDSISKQSSFENRKTKLKANMTSVGEWFKQAAWLQVIIIVGIIFGLLLSIPAIIQCSQNLSKNSKFFGENTIPIARFLDEDGKNSRNNSGLIGEGKLDGTESYSTDSEGFVILFYNVDDTEFMGDQQLNFETAYEKLQKDNKSIGKNTKFFSINVSWNIDWKDGDTNDFKALSNYNNKYLSLEEQKKIFSDAILPTYTTQVNGSGKYGNNSNYVSDTVKLSNLQNSDFTLEYAGGAATDVYHTIPTCFLTYTKNKNTNKYDISKPDKVRFKQSLDLSSVDNATKEILDLFNFKINTSTRIQ